MPEARESFDLPAEESAAAELAGDLAQLRADLDAAQDRALRAQADLDNYRKRAQRELQEERRFAELPLVRDLLPVRDNLQRAIDAAQGSPEAGGLLAGVKLVAEQLAAVLKQHHCTEIPAAPGQPFDVNLHQAVSTQPSQDHPPGAITTVMQSGYQLHDRVIRPAMVVVASAE
jgi:molecular chaperone GrpE